MRRSGFRERSVNAGGEFLRNFFRIVALALDQLAEKGNGADVFAERVARFRRIEDELFRTRPLDGVRFGRQDDREGLRRVFDVFQRQRFQTTERRVRGGEDEERRRRFRDVAERRGEDRRHFLEQLNVVFAVPRLVKFELVVQFFIFVAHNREERDAPAEKRGSVGGADRRGERLVLTEVSGERATERFQRVLRAAVFRENFRLAANVVQIFELRGEKFERFRRVLQRSDDLLAVDDEIRRLEKRSHRFESRDRFGLRFALRVLRRGAEAVDRFH